MAITDSSVPRLVHGIELEKRFKKYFKENGLMVFNDISQVENNKYDIITLFHVLEHIPEPRKLLQKLSNMLSKDSRIIIEVPNLHLYGMLCTGISYEHLVHFSPAHLGFLVQKAGFEIIEFEFGETSRLEGFIILAEKKPNLIPPKFTKEYEINQS